MTVSSSATEGPFDPERAIAELLDRLEIDGPAALEELCSRYPEHAEELRSRVRVLCEVGLLPGSAVGRELPERLGEFRLLERLGEGGMGVVFLAEQETLGRRVALKLVRPESLYFQGARDRFRREVEAVAALAHPGIASIFSVGEERGLPYFAMEYVVGASLGDAIAHLQGLVPAELTGADLGRAVLELSGEEPAGELGPIFTGTWSEACVRVVRQTAEALEHAHRRGILHRDIKPSNVMLTPEGRALLVDFGLASRDGSARITRTGSLLGSLAYMSPEQLAAGAELGPRSDLYSLGATLFELLTLGTPFRTGSEEQLRRAVTEGTPRKARELNPRVPAELETVCAVAMELEPSRRYASAEAFARDLTHVLEGTPIEARRPVVAARAWRWTRRHPAAAAAAALATILVVGGPVGYGVVQAGARSAIETVNDQLTEANQTVEGTNAELSLALDKARRERARAEGNLDEAVAAIDRFLTRVGAERLDDQPGLQPMRAELLGDAVEFYGALIEAQPERPELASRRLEAEVAKAGVVRQLGQLTEAEAALRESLGTAVNQYEADPTERSAQQLTETRHELAKVLIDAGRLREAAEVLSSGRRQVAEFIERDPASRPAVNWQVSLAATHGVVLDLLGESAAAADAANDAVSAASRMDFDAASPSTRLALASALGVRSRRAEREHDLEAAVEDRAAGVELLRGLLTDEPSSRRHRAEFVSHSSVLGQLLGDAGKLDQARLILEETRLAAAGLSADYPSFVRYRDQLAISSSALAGVLAAQDRTAESLECVERAIEVLERLVEEDEDTPERLALLSGALVNLGIHHQWSEAYEDALDCFTRAGTYQARGLELSPDNAQLRFIQAVTVANEGTVLIWMNEPSAAVKCFARAAETGGEEPRFLRYLAGEYLRAAAAAESEAEAADYDDAGCALLQRAIAAGYRDFADLEESPQLDRLRSRPDFAEFTALR